MDRVVSMLGCASVYTRVHMHVRCHTEAMPTYRHLPANTLLVVGGSKEVVALALVLGPFARDDVARMALERRQEHPPGIDRWSALAKYRLLEV